MLKEFIERYKAEYGGTANAYKTLVLAGGADVKPIQADLKNLEFRAVQGHAEARIAMAGGVPDPGRDGRGPRLLDLQQLRQCPAAFRGRHDAPAVADRVGVAAAAAHPPTPMTRLWYDDRGISFLREDLADVVQIQAAEAATIRQLVDAGYTPGSVVKALRENDWRRLAHSGLFSVQLQTPGAGAPALPKGPGVSTKTLRGFEIKSEAEGTVTAVFATLGVKDSDGDVTVDGAFGTAPR